MINLKVRFEPGKTALSPSDADPSRSATATCQVATVVALTTESLRHVKDRFSEFVDRVERTHERVVVTRNGRPAALLISIEDMAALEETLAVLGDPEARAELAEAEQAYARGDVVRGVDAVRALRRR